LHSDYGVDNDTVWSCWCGPFAKVCHSRVQRKTLAELWLAHVLKGEGKCLKCSRWKEQIFVLDEDQSLEYAICTSQSNDFSAQRQSWHLIAILWEQRQKWST
jgi:hypothetical protein